MKRFMALALFAVALPLRADPTLPVTPRDENQRDTRFGVTLDDPYRWLEDGASPRVRAWVDAQDAAARRALDGPDRAPLEKRLAALYQSDDVSVPVTAGRHRFYTRRDQGLEKARLYLETPSGPRIVLDPNTWPAERNASLGDWWPSPDGRWLLYAVRDHHADKAVLRLRRVDTGHERKDETIEGADFAWPAWTSTSDGFFYFHLPPGDGQGRVAQAPVRFHRVGRPAAADPVVFPATGDPERFLTPSVSPDGRWLFVKEDRGWSSSRVFAKPVAGGTFVTLFASTSSAATITEVAGRFICLTTSGAPAGVVWSAPARQAPPRWTLLLPESPERLKQGIFPSTRGFLLHETRSLASALRRYDAAGRFQGDVPLPGLGTVGAVELTPDGQELAFDYQSFFSPPQVYRVRGAKPPSIWARSPAPVDASLFVAETLEYRSSDGVNVPLFLLRRRDVRADGAGAAWLRGYGGFAEVLSPRFQPVLIPWLEAGGVVAVAHLRGDGTKGEAWHQAAMGRQKQRTFDDMIAAASFMAASGWANPQRIVIDGASNGGLTAAAVLTQRPELFAAAVIKVPLTDMVRYPLSGQGRSWVAEYGSPEVEGEFQALAAYSPYHRISRRAYPPVLLLSADHDDRVDPMHASKFAAKLQWANQAPTPILLRTYRQSGHAGADRVSARVGEAVDRDLFLMRAVSLTGQTHEISSKP